MNNKQILKLVYCISHTIICTIAFPWFQEVFDINFVGCSCRNTHKRALHLRFDLDALIRGFGQTFFYFSAAVLKTNMQKFFAKFDNCDFSGTMENDSEDIIFSISCCIIGEIFTSRIVHRNTMERRENVSSENMKTLEGHERL